MGGDLQHAWEQEGETESWTGAFVMIGYEDEGAAGYEVSTLRDSNTVEDGLIIATKVSINGNLRPARLCTMAHTPLDFVLTR